MRGGIHMRLRRASPPFAWSLSRCYVCYGHGNRLRGAKMSPEAWPEPLFGINVDPGAGASHLAFDLALLADQSGLDFIGIQAHPYNGAFLDTWTLLAVLGAKTSRVRLLTNVA